jgi:hypothetical protein
MMSSPDSYMTRLGLRVRSNWVSIRSLWYRTTGRCGATEYIYGACNRKRNHADNPVGMYGEKYAHWHAEYRHNELWAEWSGR